MILKMSLTIPQLIDPFGLFTFRIGIAPECLMIGSINAFDDMIYLF